MRGQLDACGGFLARFIPVVLPDAKRLVHFVRPPDEQLWSQLIFKFVRISQLSGSADISSVYSAASDCAYAEWYEETSKRWTGKGTIASIFFKRWRVFVLKLAVVFEMSRSESLQVSVESFERAANWLQKLEAIVFKLAGDEFSGDALRLHRKEKFFRAAGALGIMPSIYDGQSGALLNSRELFLWYWTPPLPAHSQHSPCPRFSENIHPLQILFWLLVSPRPETAPFGMALATFRFEVYEPRSQSLGRLPG
jgi:hypothetical protein